MSVPAWHEEPIAKEHDRSGFDCGDADMNAFLARYARQSHEQNATKTYCAIELARPGRILGFYSIAPSAVAHAAVPARMTTLLTVSMGAQRDGLRPIHSRWPERGKRDVSSKIVCMGSLWPTSLRQHRMRSRKPIDGPPPVR